jgi:hypothetical protein
MTATSKLLRIARISHLYLGIFVAPALLFFAFTGAMQTFSLHEKPLASTGKPPHWIAVLARLHKDQMTYIPPRHGGARGFGGDHSLVQAHNAVPQPASAVPHVAAAGTKIPADAGPPAGRPKMPNALPMKLFFLLVTLALGCSVVSGLLMAFQYKGNKPARLAVLCAGVAVPLVLLLLQARP